MSHDEPCHQCHPSRFTKELHEEALVQSRGPAVGGRASVERLGVWRVPGMTRIAISHPSSLFHCDSVPTLFLKTNHAFEAAMLFTSSKSKHPQFFWKPPSAAKLLATLWPWANWRNTSTITKAKDQITGITVYLQVSLSLCVCVCESIGAKAHSANRQWYIMISRVCVCVLIPVICMRAYVQIPAGDCLVLLR